MVAILVRCTVVTNPIVVEVVPPILPGPCEYHVELIYASGANPELRLPRRTFGDGTWRCAAHAIK